MCCLKRAIRNQVDAVHSSRISGGSCSKILSRLLSTLKKLRRFATVSAESNPLSLDKSSLCQHTQRGGGVKYKMYKGERVYVYFEALCPFLGCAVHSFRFRGVFQSNDESQRTSHSDNEEWISQKKYAQAFGSVSTLFEAIFYILSCGGVFQSNDELRRTSHSENEQRP